MSFQSQVKAEKKPSFTPDGFLQRKCDKCKKKELLQRSFRRRPDLLKCRLLCMKSCARPVSH